MSEQSELCLVTGGAGFIGSHLVEELLANGHRVRVLDDFSTGLRTNLDQANSRLEILEGCITDPGLVERAVAGVRTIFHLAAMPSVARSVEDPLRCHDVTTTGTLHVLNAARTQGVHSIVFAASSSAYGPASDPAGQDESTPLCPLSPYAASKLASEHYLEAFAATYGLNTVRLRFFNIFGPRQRADSPYSGVIAIFSAAISEGRVPLIHGDGLQTRDYTFVSDAVQAMIRASKTPGVSGRVYNVGTGNAVTLIELVAALNRQLGKDIQPQHGPTRLGDVRFSRARIDKIEAELGYRSAITFEEGLRRTVEWYLSTKNQ